MCAFETNCLINYAFTWNLIIYLNWKEINYIYCMYGRKNKIKNVWIWNIIYECTLKSKTYTIVIRIKRGNSWIL